ncbi:unnamed protein product [Alternaria burnsii]|nr:unnamed protein product [Alternaria burnsii]
MKGSNNSSAVYTTLRPLPPPPFSAITRPTVRTNRYPRDDSSEDETGPQSQSETAMENIISQPQPLSYTYDTFMCDTGSTERQHPIDMPDHNKYVKSILAESRRDQDLLQSPPYPIHGQCIEGRSAGAMHNNGSNIRRPTTEDYLRSDHPLPAPPPEYDSDQDLPVIEPDSCFPENFHNEHEPQQVDTQFQESYLTVPERHSAAANALTYPKSAIKPNYKHSQPDIISNSHVPVLAYEPTMPEHYGTPERVPTISVDMYQPALGGLQMVSGMQRSDSKRNRVWRWMKGHNPFRRGREFERQQKDQ